MLYTQIKGTDFAIQIYFQIFGRFYRMKQIKFFKKLLVLTNLSHVIFFSNSTDVYLLKFPKVSGESKYKKNFFLSPTFLQ